tara:strand:+ start:1626 stop:1952 length:327 start_codon:yes stop_codon:yes gene_type:complete
MKKIAADRNYKFASDGKIQGGPQAIELPKIEGIEPRDLIIYLQNNRDSSLSHREKLLRWRLPTGVVNDEDMVDRNTAERLLMVPHWAKLIAEAFKKDYPAKGDRSNLK